MSTAEGISLENFKKLEGKQEIALACGHIVVMDMSRKTYKRGWPYCKRCGARNVVLTVRKWQPGKDHVAKRPSKKAKPKTAAENNGYISEVNVIQEPEPLTKEKIRKELGKEEKKVGDADADKKPGETVSMEAYVKMQSQFESARQTAAEFEEHNQSLQRELTELKKNYGRLYRQQQRQQTETRPATARKRPTQSRPRTRR